MEDTPLLTLFFLMQTLTFKLSINGLRGQMVTEAGSCSQ